MSHNNNYIRCLELLMAPIARLCLKHSLKLQELLEIFKRVLVNVAKEDLVKNKQQVSVSRLHIMTGVHRQDISRIESEKTEPKIEGLITKVIGQWQHDKRFQTETGKPKTLEATGKESEFFELVQTVNKDLNPYTVLFELERIGALEKTPRGVKLVSMEYVPRGSLESGYSLLARDFEDLLWSVEENLRSPEYLTPNHHIQTEYDEIPARFHSKIKEWFFKEGISFHEKARKFLSQYDTDINKTLKNDRSDKKLKVSFASFSRIQDKDD